MSAEKAGLIVGLHLKSFVYWKCLRGTLMKSEDPDEMPQNAAFHQGLHCLLRKIQLSGTREHNYLKISTPDP